MAKILTVIISGVIIYMILQKNLDSLNLQDELKLNNPTQTEEKKAKSEQELTGSFFEKTISNILINVLKTHEGRTFVARMLKPENNTTLSYEDSFASYNDSFLNSTFQISTVGDGNGLPVFCGQTVNIHYKILNFDDVALEEKTETIHLGSEQIAPSVDAVIIGMKVGQTRHAVISSKDFVEIKNDKHKSFKIDIVLKSIISKSIIDSDIKMFDEKVPRQMPLICAKRAVYDAKITKLGDGSIIFDSTKTGKKIDMVIGNLNYPVIFSYALHNKIAEGTKTVIAKGKFFKSHLSEHSIIFPEKSLPENEYFMIEFFGVDR